MEGRNEIQKSDKETSIQSTDFLQILPKEILNLIISELELKDLVKIRLISKKNKQIIDDMFSKPNPDFIFTMLCNPKMPLVQAQYAMHFIDKVKRGYNQDVDEILDALASDDVWNLVDTVKVQHLLDKFVQNKNYDISFLSKNFEIIKNLKMELSQKDNLWPQTSTNQNISVLIKKLLRREVSFINLSGFNFSFLCLEGEKEENINLQYSNLYKTDFTNTNLSYINFQFSKITNAKFIGVLAENLDFQNANLQETTFCGSFNEINFANADLRNVIFSQRTESLSYNGFWKSNFTNANLSSTKFETRIDKSNFTNANLVGTQLHHGIDVIFNNSNLTNANLSDGYFWNVSFENANLTGANLENSDFNDTKFKNANLIGVKINGKTRFKRVDLEGAQFLSLNIFNSEKEMLSALTTLHNNIKDNASVHELRQVITHDFIKKLDQTNKDDQTKVELLESILDKPLFKHHEYKVVKDAINSVANVATLFSDKKERNEILIKSDAQKLIYEKILALKKIISEKKDDKLRNDWLEM